MPFDLICYLNRHFSGLYLDGGLFYRWPFGIRFDLRGRAVTPEDTDEVLKRAATVYEAVFDPKSLCVIVAQDWPGDDYPPIGLTHLSPLFKFAQQHSIGVGTPQDKVELADPIEPENGPCTLTWITVPSRSFAYEMVLEGIANADHAREPSIGGRVYFINTLTYVIVHMYDDRGMDVIATDHEELRGLHRDLDEWILDCDRAAIDHTFATKRPPHI
jgi:hypothetical protein